MLRVHAHQSPHEAGLPAKEGAAHEQGVPSHTRLHFAGLVARLHVQGCNDALYGSIQCFEVQAQLLHRLRALRCQLVPDRLELSLRQCPREHVVARTNLDVLHGVVVLIAQVVAVLLHDEAQGGAEGSGYGTCHVFAGVLPKHHVGRRALAILQLADSGGADLRPVRVQAREADLDAVQGDALDSVGDIHLQHDVALEHMLDDLDRVLRLGLGEVLWLAGVQQWAKLALLRDLAEHTCELGTG
mmetsp:Transcript_77971/g.176222  ORF Transcript_77971/g.176222 Transcript_77971/m.176222 type:complete len:243 (-) Transcript_77971:82-810(-)